jgi:response regulator RpfG family c-di-GMP phosphodiesterase
MPEMSGDTIAKNIRALGHHASTPIIAFTANIFRKNWDTYQAAGIDGYLLKPFTEKDMHQLLQSYLGNGELPAQPLEEVQPLPTPSAEQPPYSLDNIKKFTGNDTEALVGFLEGFMMTNQDNIHHLQEAAENDDTAILSFYAHKMMPNIQHMGADKLVSILKKLELLSEEDTLTKEVTDQVQKAIALTRELIAYVEEEILSLKARV